MNDIQEVSSYEDAVAYLNSFINYEKKRSDQFAPEVMEVDRPVRLLAALGNPHQAYPTIHIAGTKGKGSTAAFCAAALSAAGYRVGFYTSPHLLDIRERFRILAENDADGWVSKEAFIELVRQIQDPVADEPGLTWYEIFTTLAFLHFAQEKVDVAVVEVGLGGRLDATNVVTPLASVITSISFDHMSLLGDSLAAIAAEKGGIIKQGIPVVMAPQAAEARDVLLSIAATREASVVEVGQTWQGQAVAGVESNWLELLTVPAGSLLAAGEKLQIGLLGEHQAENALVALATLEIARATLSKVDATALRAGLRDLVWPGRLQRLVGPVDGPAIVADGAHNGDSAAKLLKALRTHYQYERLILIMGSGVDKDYGAMLQQFVPGVDRLILTAAPHPRAAAPELLREAVGQIRLKIQDPGPDWTLQTAPSLEEALRLAVDGANQSDLICVTGTLFLVAELLKEWDNWQIF